MARMAMPFACKSGCSIRSSIKTRKRIQTFYCLNRPKVRYLYIATTQRLKDSPELHD